MVDALDMPEVPPRMVEQLGERQFQAALLQMIEDVRGAGAGRAGGLGSGTGCRYTASTPAPLLAQYAWPPAALLMCFLALTVS